MTSPLSKAADEALALYRQYDALARLNARKADDELAKFIDAMTGGSLLSQTPDALPTSLPRCVRVWTKWLAENGPDTNMNIRDQTGVKFDKARTHTILWDDVAGDIDNDDLVPPNTIIRFKGIVQTEGRGANPVIYALWSQRFDVRPKFGEGPARPGDPEPDLGQQYFERVTAPTTLAPEDEAVIDGLLHPTPEPSTCRTCDQPITLDDRGRWLTENLSWTCLGDPEAVHNPSDPEPTEPLLGVVHPPTPDIWQDQAWQAAQDIGVVNLTAEDLAGPGIVDTLSNQDAPEGDEDDQPTT